jgi:hypothetical protein
MRTIDDESCLRYLVRELHDEAAPPGKSDKPTIPPQQLM